MSKMYGSVISRLTEGHNYNEDKMIHEGDDITMYYYSNRTCYYVTKVVDQKHIFVHQYQVVADREKTGGMGHQNWKFFKTVSERNKYLNKFFEDKYKEDVEECEDEEWVFRYKHWNMVSHVDKKTIEEIKQRDGFCAFVPTEKEMKKLNEGKSIMRYHKIDNKVSFGIKDYYHDWEH